jgi:hypothetical protein
MYPIHIVVKRMKEIEIEIETTVFINCSMQFDNTSMETFQYTRSTLKWPVAVPYSASHMRYKC